MYFENAILASLSGDLNLEMIINIINAEVRISDTLGIWQSQQLLILSPETNAEGVRVLNNKIINAIENYDFNSPFLPKMVSQVGTLKKEDIDYFIHKIENNLGHISHQYSCYPTKKCNRF